MDEETIIRRLLQLNEEFQAQWDADVAALRALVREEASLPLRMGDLFNTLRERWRRKLPELAKEAGVSPHTARQRARVAARIPPGSPLRALDLPYSILRLLASLEQPEPWAERARALQAGEARFGREADSAGGRAPGGELNVRAFARELADAGLRRRRASRPLCCLHCGSEIPEHAPRVYLRLGDRAGRFCSPQHAATYLTAPTAIPSAALPAAADPKAAQPTRTLHFAPGEDTESHRISAPFLPRPDEPARLLALLTAEGETGVACLLCRVPHARLTVPTARAPATHPPPSPPRRGRPSVAGKTEATKASPRTRS